MRPPPAWWLLWIGCWWYAMSILAAAVVLVKTETAPGVVVILPQHLVPPATRQVVYTTTTSLGRPFLSSSLDPERQQRALSQTLPGWHHVLGDASVEHPDQVFAAIRAAAAGPRGQTGVTVASSTAPSTTVFGASHRRRTTQHNSGSSSTFWSSLATLFSGLGRRPLQNGTTTTSTTTSTTTANTTTARTTTTSASTTTTTSTNEEAFTGQEIELDIHSAYNNNNDDSSNLTLSFQDDNSTVTSDGTVSSETEYNITDLSYSHDDHDGNNVPDTTTIVSTNNTATAMEYRPLRIKAFVSNEAGNAQYLNNTEHSLLLNQILRPALLAWSAALRVPPVAHTLTVDATQLKDGKYCGAGPSVEVPLLHTTIGVANVDMLLYVHMAFTDPRRIMNNNNHANSSSSTSGAETATTCAGDYVAASSFCSTDQLDRPVAALLHLCITDNFFTDIQSNIQAVMHEIGHALGFNAISLAHFRKPDGSPWTKRNPDGSVPVRTVQCTGPYDVSAKIPVPSAEILQFQTVRGGVRVAQVVTPSVRQVVRNHFDCQALPGAELESGEYLPESLTTTTTTSTTEPTDTTSSTNTSTSSSTSTTTRSPIKTATTSCIGDHWERRLFQTDLMNPIIDEKVSFNPFFSTLTLAYFADSGWYQVDLSRASMASNWGRAAGCDFVEKDCIRDGQVPSKYEAFFCAQEDDTEALEMRGCTIDLERKAFCSLGQFDGELPLAYQYFPHGSNLGGNDPFMDYCPVYSGFANGLCTDQANEALLRASTIERFGKRNSRCVGGRVASSKVQSILVPSTGKSQGEGSGNFSHSVLVSLPTEQGAFCLPIACVVEDRSLRVQVDGVWEICREKDEVIIPRASLDVMSVVCPDPVRVCPTFYCSRDCLGTNKYCNYTVGQCMCEAGLTSESEEGPCVNTTTDETLVNRTGDSASNDSTKCKSGQTFSTKEGSCVDVTAAPAANAPFYRPESERDSSLPNPEDPLSDIYVETARNLREDDRPWFWSVRNTSLIALAVFVVIALISAYCSRNTAMVSFLRSRFHDDSPPRHPGLGSPDFEVSASPDKLKLIASLVVDLRMNNTGDMQSRLDILQQRGSETDVASEDVASESSFISYAGTIADLSEQIDITSNNGVVVLSDAPALSSSGNTPRPIRRRGFFAHHV